MYMDLDTNMRAIGKRYPYLARYRVASTREGIISAVDVEVFADCGCNPVENSIDVLRKYIDNGRYRRLSCLCITNLLYALRSVYLSYANISFLLAKLALQIVHTCPHALYSSLLCPQLDHCHPGLQDSHSC